MVLRIAHANDQARMQLAAMATEFEQSNEAKTAAHLYSPLGPQAVACAPSDI